MAARSDERKKLERLCRYISRPVVSEKRLSLTSNGNIRYQLKTPYRDGTTHVIFEPLDFMARLAALGRFLPPIIISSVSGVCRSLPHGNHFSVTAYEKADTQILYVRDREVPESDPCDMEVKGELRPTDTV